MARIGESVTALRGDEHVLAVHWHARDRRRGQQTLARLLRGQLEHLGAVDGLSELGRGLPGRCEELQGDVIGVSERQARPIGRVDDTAVGDPK